MKLPPLLFFSLGLLCVLSFAKTSTAQSGEKVLSDLRLKFDAARSAEADRPFEESAASLREKYLSAIEREIARTGDAGDPDSALLARQELETIKATAVGEEPATEPPAGSLTSMRQVYRDHLQGLRRERDARLHRIAQAFLPEVTRAEGALCSAGDQAGALAVRAFGESLASDFPAPDQSESSSSTVTAPVTAPVTGPVSDSRVTADGFELFDPIEVECIYDAAPSSSENEALRDDYYILEQDGGKGRLRIEFSDPRFASSLETVKAITLNCRVAEVTDAETTDTIKVSLNGKVIGFQLGAEEGTKVQIPLDKKAAGGANPIVLEVTCGENAVILETSGSKRPQLAIKF